MKKYKNLILAIAFMMMIFTSCKKENITHPQDATSTEVNDLGGPPAPEGDPTGDGGPGQLTNYFSWDTEPWSHDGGPTVILAATYFRKTIDKYTTLRISFTYNSNIIDGSGSNPTALAEVFEVDCNTGQILPGPPVFTQTLTGSNGYGGNFSGTFNIDLPTSKCYILKVTTPDGQVHYTNIASRVW